MKTLRNAVEEYITMRRGLGYKLKYESKALSDFVYFLEQEGSNHITIWLKKDGRYVTDLGKLYTLRNLRQNLRQLNEKKN